MGSESGGGAVTPTGAEETRGIHNVINVMSTITGLFIYFITYENYLKLHFLIQLKRDAFVNIRDFLHIVRYYLLLLQGRFGHSA